MKQEGSATGIFDQEAARYDAWYDTPTGRAIFAAEVAALRPLLADLPHPWLEVGVGGGLVLGLVLAEGPWGHEYQKRAAAGHPYYQHAHFFTRADLASLLAAADLHPVRVRSALYGLPDAAPTTTDARDGDDPTAGFTALLVMATKPG